MSSLNVDCSSLKIDDLLLYTREEIIRIIYKCMSRGDDGLSAYEVAVENGFTGTLEEWFISIRGEQGIQGIRGNKGDKGDKGDTGAVANIDYNILLDYILDNADAMEELAKEINSGIVAVHGNIDTSKENIIGFNRGEYSVAFTDTSKTLSISSNLAIGKRITTTDLGNTITDANTIGD